MSPVTPPSLVKCNDIAFSDMTGCFDSTPIRLQVPLLMNTLCSSMCGTAAIALAVS